MSSESTSKNPGSDAEFAFWHMQGQLESLPGDVTEPTNSDWQVSVVASILHKVIFLKQSNENFYPEKVKNLLNHHVDRLRHLGIYAVQSAKTLETIASTLDKDENLDQSA